MVASVQDIDMTSGICDEIVGRMRHDADVFSKRTSRRRVVSRMASQVVPTRNAHALLPAVFECAHVAARCDRCGVRC